jgi:hypothetical protein
VSFLVVYELKLFKGHKSEAINIPYKLMGVRVIQRQNHQAVEVLKDLIFMSDAVSQSQNKIKRGSSIKRSKALPKSLPRPEMREGSSDASQVLEHGTEGLGTFC